MDVDDLADKLDAAKKKIYGLLDGANPPVNIQPPEHSEGPSAGKFEQEEDAKSYSADRLPARARSPQPVGIPAPRPRSIEKAEETKRKSEAAEREKEAEREREKRKREEARRKAQAAAAAVAPRN